MTSDITMLNFILQNAEMGRTGITHVLPHAKEEKMQQALNNQLIEYDKIYITSMDMLHKRNEQPEHINAMAKLSSYVMSTMKTLTNPSTSKIAEMMIEGSTMGVTKIIKHLNEYDGDDERVRDLANKLLKTEQLNIDQMKKML
ncbi:MAG: hypothetical protein HFE85_05130 [Clostridiales bacterium]|nr:hypothetical protein [Clostridiales bacterium]